MIKLRDMKNRGRTHLFLGDAMSNGLDKTVVEPGNAFSPGLWTAGVALAVLEGELIAPQTRDLPIRFDEMPVVVSEYTAGEAQVKSELCHLGGVGWQGVDYFKATIDRPVEDAALAIGDVGPAGGKLKGMLWDAEANALIIAGGAKFVFETPVDVEIYPADDAHDSPFALAHFQGELKVKVLHGYDGRGLPLSLKTLPERCALSVDEGFAQTKKAWREALPSRVYGPDPRIERSWEQSAFHMLSSMDNGLPRITVNNHPIFWIRDCVIVLRALDLMGRSDLTRIGCDSIAPTVFSGGYGSESDNPGEGLWALGEHAAITGDAAWARKILPALDTRVEWIERMLTTDEPIYLPIDMRTIYAHYRPDSTLVCYPHEGNHIHGRMDWHSPDLYINCWAWTGLKSAAKAAKLAGDPEREVRWSDMADKLEKAIVEELMVDYGNDRDSCAMPYPCGIPGGNWEKLREDFNAWYDKNRLTPDGKRNPEPLWTYFEAAQIHNAIMLGERERAWTNLDGFLDDERWMKMSLYIEGEWGASEMLPYGTGLYGRGWLQEGAFGANMPHNWTNGEAFLMLRDMFVRDDGDMLTLFSGVPESWIVPGARFGAENLPTAFGPVSVEAVVDDRGEVSVTFTRGGEIPYRLDLPKKRG